MATSQVATFSVPLTLSNSNTQKRIDQNQMVLLCRCARKHGAKVVRILEKSETRREPRM